MKGMILAAGYGTRFRPLTYILPKPMVPLCNRPLIGWAVQSFLDGDVREIIVNLHHLPEPIESHLREHYGKEAQFHFSFEEIILGTGGGVRRVREILERDEEFFLVNGDTVQFPNWQALRDARVTSLAALTLRHPPPGDRFTAVFRDRDLITGFGKGAGEALMFSGSHCIGRRVFEYIPDKDFSGIVDEVYQRLIETQRETIAAIVDDGFWFDIGTPKRYLSAMEGLLEAMARGEVTPPDGSRMRGNSLVHETASVTSAIRSTIGARSIVHAEVSDTAIWNNCVIGESVRLTRCIVGHGVELAGTVSYENALICRDDAAIPQDTTCERRDGLVIVPV